MKFMLFAATALAASTMKRQVSVVEDAFTAISSGTTSLRDGINAFQGLADAGALEEAASGLVDTINQANTDVGAIEPLGNEAAGLASPIQDLAALVSSTVDDLVAKKQTFIDAGVAGVVLTQAQSLRDAANTFRTTTLSKVPESLQDLGNQLSQPISDALDRAVQEYTGLDDGGDDDTTTTTTGGTEPTSTGGSEPTSTGGDSYTTPAPTTPAPTGGASTTSSSAVATYTGAAIVNAANGYGAVAMAVLAGAAML